MTTNSNVGAAVCGESLDVNCMNLFKYDRAQKMLTQLGEKAMFQFSIDRGIVQIVKEISKEYRFEHAHPADAVAFCQGDSINGKKIIGYACDIPHKEGVGSRKVRSSAHSRQNWTVKSELCYAVIISSAWGDNNISPPPSQVPFSFASTAQAQQIL